MNRRSQAELTQAHFNTWAKRWSSEYERRTFLSERPQSFLNYLDRHFERPGRLLDIGSGAGQIAHALSTAGWDVTGVDSASAMIEAARSRWPTQDWQVIMPLGTGPLPFKTASFDAAIASGVLEYVQDIEKGLAECRRVLKPGGIFIAHVVNLRHPIRWIEAAVRLGEPGLRWIPHRRTQGWLSYIRLSRTRLRQRSWIRAFSAAHFEVLSLERTDEPLAFLIARAE